LTSRRNSYDWNAFSIFLLPAMTIAALPTAMGFFIFTTFSIFGNVADIGFPLVLGTALTIGLADKMARSMDVEPT